MLQMMNHHQDLIVNVLSAMARDTAAAATPSRESAAAAAAVSSTDAPAPAAADSASDNRKPATKKEKGVPHLTRVKSPING